MSRKVEVAAEFAPAEFFGRSDLRFNRLIQYLFDQGIIEDVTDRAFADAIGRQSDTVRRWRSYVSFPNSVSLVKIARRFDVDVNWLVGLSGNSLENAFATNRKAVAA